MRQHRPPVAKSVVEKQLLCGVARQGQRGQPARRTGSSLSDQRGQLRGREILGFVDKQVGQGGFPGPHQLIGPQKDGQVVGVEQGLVILGALAVDANFAAHVLVVVYLIALAFKAPHALRQI